MLCILAPNIKAMTTAAEQNLKAFVIQASLPADELAVWEGYPDYVQEQILYWMVEANDCASSLAVEGHLMTAIEVYHDEYVERYGDYRNDRTDNDDSASDFYYEQARDAKNW